MEEFDCIVWSKKDIRSFVDSLTATTIANIREVGVLSKDLIMFWRGFFTCLIAFAAFFRLPVIELPAELKGEVVDEG